MLAIVLIVLVALMVVLVVLYNNLVSLRNRVDNAWAQVEVQLQRRLDLIPNLVETVKGYAVHESQTLDAVVAARSQVTGASGAQERMSAENALTGTLRTLFAVAESYPDLKASANFQQLQAELSDTEDKISYMRQSYNDTVMRYNTATQTFPGVIVAGLFGFGQRTSFSAEEGASAAPKVRF